MKKNNIEREQLENLFHNYNIEEPISLSDKKTTRQNKNIIYKKILKNLGLLSFVTTMTLTLKFWLNKLGISAYLSKILGVIFITTTVSIGTYYFIEEKNTDEVKPVVIKKAEKIIDYKIGVLPVKSTTAKHYIINTFLHSIMEDFKKCKNNEFATRVTKQNLSNLQYIMRSTIEVLDKEHIILIKVVDRNKNSIIYVSKFSFQNQKQIPLLTKKIAKAICKKIK